MTRRAHGMNRIPGLIEACTPGGAVSGNWLIQRLKVRRNGTLQRIGAIAKGLGSVRHRYAAGIRASPRMDTPKRRNSPLAARNKKTAQLHATTQTPAAQTASSMQEGRFAGLPDRRRRRYEAIRTRVEQS